MKEVVDRMEAGESLDSIEQSLPDETDTLSGDSTTAD